MRTFFFLSLLCLALSLLAASTTESVRAGDLFNQALPLFKKGAFREAEPLLRQLLQKYGQAPVAEEAAVLLVQCYIRAEKYEEARWILNLFPKKYPTSLYLARCAYYLGLVRAYEGDPFGASRNFLYVYYRSENPDLIAFSEKALLLLFRRSLTADQVAELAPKMIEGSPLKGTAVYYTGLLYLNQKRFEKATEWLTNFSKRFSGHPLSAQAADLLKMALEKEESVVKIGVLLPFTSENAFYNEAGNSVLSGIQTAIQIYNSRNAVQVKAVVRDTRANPVNAYQTTRDLVDNEKVAALIGPLSSEEVCVTAALTAMRQIPVVSPTASAVGIDSVGPHVFKLTPSKSAMVGMLAEYAVDSLKIGEYAVIFPNDPYGVVLAEAFRSAMEENGVDLLGYEMYARGEKNFKPILNRLHKRMAERIFEKRAMESGELLGKMEERRITVDSIFLADSSVRIGAVFMPGYPDEIVMLGPQLPFYKINTQMLGEMGWYDPAVLKHAGRYLDSAVIAVDFFQPPESAEWAAFNERYSALYRRNADVQAGLGYDAAGLILSCVKEENNGALLKRMMSLERYLGVTTRFCFDSKWHANRTAMLIRIHDEEFLPLSKE